MPMIYNLNSIKVCPFLLLLSTLYIFHAILYLCNIQRSFFILIFLNFLYMSILL
ncbi:hypothetical protein J3Q64DRAFT_1762958 [Phycomyces blakesleeanus]|uniref:Uncharacterized protein n=1 Tax=Phycomyces blakesleeanus TaxID=4837 RepID=A0ABR3AQT7_PHYBL